MSAATAVTARGPLTAILSNTSSQWIVIGMGAYTLLGPDKIRELLRPLLTPSSNPNNQPNQLVPQNERSIIIQTTGDNKSTGDKSSSLGMTMVTYVVGAGCVWISFTVLSQLLPEYIGELLPVTKRVFDAANKRLGNSLKHVQDVLGKQILNLLQKQDTLEKKQDDMHSDINDLSDNVDNIRQDMINLGVGMERCESGINNVEKLQTYTARGVKLLVTAVSSILPNDDRITRELTDYARDGELMRAQLRQADRNNNTRGQLRGRSHSRRSLSPQTSVEEISTTTPEQEHPVQTFLDGDNDSAAMMTEQEQQLQDLMALIRGGGGQVAAYDNCTRKDKWCVH